MSELASFICPHGHTVADANHWCDQMGDRGIRATDVFLSPSSRTLSIVHRQTGDVAMMLHVSDWSVSSFERMWDGLVRKVDFETWMPVYSPERGDDETVAEWLAS